MSSDDDKLAAYMVKWNRFRRESGHVLAASELLALAELLRELDAELDKRPVLFDAWHFGDGANGGIRARLERLLGMHPGSLDTSRK